jgi:D-glycero-D-manno-heptose 1,7-bisphosphate phosphatase
MRSVDSTKSAVFLDRDGTVSEEVGYMYDVSQYRVFPWTGPAIRRINAKGLYVILATNQSGIERGYFTEDMVHRVHRRLAEEIGRSGAQLDAAYFCPHHPDRCHDCRKPNPGMLLRARDEMGIDLKSSFMVGDRHTDIRTGKAAGTRTVLVMTGDGREERERNHDAEIQPDYFADDLADAVDYILKQ